MRISGWLAVAALLTSQGTWAQTDWPTYGHDAGGMRYSPLTQINPGNVGQLQPAWEYHMRPAETAATAAPAEPARAEAVQAAAEGAIPRRPRSRFSASETTPLVAGGLMYASTPYRRVVALDPQTGKEVWTYEVPGAGQPSLRGVEYWPGDAKTTARILFGTRDGLMIALDARSGKPVETFGEHGIVNLKTPEIMNGKPDAPYGMTSPPVIYQNLIITGSAVQEAPAKGASGAVRAWDIHSGRLVWTFDPLSPADKTAAATWEGDSATNRSGVNVWAFMTVDAQRGLIYLPFGAPSWDRYGGDRKGDNLYSTTLVAVDAKTGKKRWHFQVVHHDIWDYDLSAPPTLIDVRREVNGKTTTIPAVALVSKVGLLFLLDRTNGKPIDPIEERPVPASDVPGEQTAPTQPFPLKTPPLARNQFSLDELATVTPELQAYCADWVKNNNMKGGGPYLPYGRNRTTILFPGLQGGANWGGASFDPGQGYLFVNTLDLGQVYSLVENPNGPMPYIGGKVNSRFWQAATRLPCQQPPWGRLTAIDVKTGAIAWQTPLGITDNLPEDKQKTGRPNVGGSIVTAGGLVFIGATDDSRFRAFDARTGKEVWTAKLPASAHATPVTYLGADQQQYVVITATGGSFLDSPITSDSIVAFRLNANSANEQGAAK